MPSLNSVPRSPVPPIRDFTGVEIGEVTLDKALEKILPAQHAGLEDIVRYLALVGGFGSGKTLWLCLDAILNGMGQPGGFTLLGRLHSPELRITTQKTFLELMPQAWTKEWVPSAAPPTLYAVNGHQFIFSHLDVTEAAARAHIRSLNLSAFYIDQAEEVTEGAFYTLMSRTRRQGVDNWRGRIVANPNGSDWVWRYFYDDKRPFRQKQLFHGLLAPTTENFNLREGYIDEMIYTFPEDWKERFIYGSFADFTDKLYKEFNSNVHGFDCDFEHEVFLDRDGKRSGHPPEEWPTIVGIDIGGGVDPWSVVFIAVDPKTGFLYQFGEIHGQGILTRQIADRYFQIMGNRPLEGAAYDWENQQVGLELADEGIPATRANKDVLAGVFKSASYLTLDPRLESPFGTGKPAPRYYVCRNCCPSTVRSLAGVSWEKNRAGNATGDIKHDEHSHDAAAFRYAVHTFRPEPRKLKMSDETLLALDRLDPLSRMYWLDVDRLKKKGYTDPHERYPEKGTHPRRKFGRPFSLRGW